MIEDHELDVSGFVRGDSESSRTGGVLLYVDKEIMFEVIAINRLAGNWWAIMIKISDKNYNGTLMLVYHSLSDADFMYFLGKVCNNDILNGNVIIMGDFNLDMKVKNYCQNKIIRIMNSAGLKQLVNESSKSVDTSETLTNLIFSND